jgi:predicted  nucleic acid-binding Zn-ribbon protein
MELIEGQKRHMAELVQRMEDQETRLAQQQQEVDVQVQELQQELAEHEEKRKKLRKGVPAPLLKRYEFIRQRRDGTAIAPVHEGVCLGCHMNILPQQFIDLQKGLEILQCPHCQRILYWADELEDDAAELQVS